VVSLSENKFFKLMGVPLSYAMSLIQKRTSEQIHKLGTVTVFKPVEEIVFILTVLRQYPTLPFLVAIFQKPKSTLHDNIYRLLDWLYPQCIPYITLQTQEERLANGIKLFILSRVTYTGAIDGCCQEVFNSILPAVDSLFYSAKANSHVINILIIASLQKKIQWISPSYPGCVIYKYHIIYCYT